MGAGFQGMYVTKNVLVNNGDYWCLACIYPSFCFKTSLIKVHLYVSLFNFFQSKTTMFLLLVTRRYQHHHIVRWTVTFISILYNNFIGKQQWTFCVRVELTVWSENQKYQHLFCFWSGLLTRLSWPTMTDRDCIYDRFGLCDMPILK